MIDPSKLATEGWTRKSVAGEPRLSEMVETYRELGMDVLLVPLEQECVSGSGEGNCAACFGADKGSGRYQVVYTRPKPEMAAEWEE